MGVRRHDADGFTLIELLVVIIIIAVLAAIAIPSYLGQRSKAGDGAAKSDLRNFAGFEEAYLTETNRYGTVAELQAVLPTVAASKDVTLTVVSLLGANGYCLSASHAKSTRTWYFDSQSGGVQPQGTTSCPVTTTGLPGGSVVG